MPELLWAEARGKTFPHNKNQKQKELILRNNLLYFNALFDLELGQYPASGLKRSSDEMTVMVATMGDTGDRVLLDVAIERDYYNYLKEVKVCAAAPFKPHEDIDFKGIAWGWNKQSKVRLEELGARCECADLFKIQSVNSRKFCSDLTNILQCGAPRSQFCSTVEQIVLACISLKDHYPVVIKPAFGGSGFGFVHFESFEEFESKRSSLPQFPDGAVVEPWLNRIHDLSSVCEILPDGTITDFRYQRTLTNSRGTFFGIYFQEKDPVIDQWKGELEKISIQAALEVAKSGYFGPLGFDSFIYEEHVEQKLAAVIEINARHVMSDIANAIRLKCAPKQCCFYRLFNKKRCRLPDNYTQLKTLLQKIEFRDGRGCFLTTPLRVGHGKQWTQPYRNAFFIAGDSFDDVMRIDNELRQRTSFPDSV